MARKLRPHEKLEFFKSLSNARQVAAGQSHSNGEQTNDVVELQDESLAADPLRDGADWVESSWPDEWGW